MENEAVCRICLAPEASKDIYDLKSEQSEKTCYEIVSFCLGIQLDEDSKDSTNMCIECIRKIISFYNFKLLALKNDTYFKNLNSNLHIKTETFLDEDLKNEEQLSYESDIYEISVDDIKIENVKNKEDLMDQSDDELLSNIKMMKYEFIPEDNKTIKNVQTKRKKCESKAISCKECGMSVINIKEHMLRHERRKNDQLRLPCPLCDKTFASYESRSQHKLKTHLGKKKTCPICNKMIKDLKNHMLLVHNPSKLRHECAQCGKRFKAEAALKQHAVVHTTDRPRPHACDVCNKTFYLLCQMTEHKLAVHLRVKTMLCQFCSKSFRSEAGLQRHLRIHTKEKPYQCKECGKFFGNTTILRNHMYTHTDENPFKCTVCDKRFKCPRYLTNHMLTHTREKRYPCNYCDMKFHRSDHVKQHHRAVHKTHLISTPLDI